MPKPLDRMTGSEITKAAAKAYAKVSANCTALIAAGFGSVRGSEIRGMAHPLAAEYIAVNDAWQELADEIAARKRWHGGTQRIIRKF